jgi:hypothetical protein
MIGCGVLEDQSGFAGLCKKTRTEMSLQDIFLPANEKISFSDDDISFLFVFEATSVSPVIYQVGGVSA